MRLRLTSWLVCGLAASTLALGCGDDDSPDSDEDSGVSADDDTSDDDTSDDDTDDDEMDSGIPDPHAIPEDASAGALQCAELASTCHPFDRGTGDLGDQCHDIGHAGNPDECMEAYDECIAFCSVDGGHHDDHDAGPSMCEELGSLCHDLDTGPDAGLAHECHEVGHSGDEAACGDLYDECVELCGEHHEEEHDAGPSMCEQLGSLCHDADTGADAGLAHECHEVGHDGDEAACGVIFDECVETCGHHEASDAG